MSGATIARMVAGARDVDEPVEVFNWSPILADVYEREAPAIARALGDRVVVEPFGSSAVIGLAGKPICDVLVGARDWRTVDVDPLVARGFEDFGAIFIAERRYLRYRVGPPPHVNVALCDVDGAFFRAQLELRDYLRAHGERAHAYGEAKRSYAAAGATMFSTYSQA